MSDLMSKLKAFKEGKEEKKIEDVVEEAVEVVEEKPKHKVTKPWERHDVHKPWKRDIYRINGKHKGFHCRWVNNDKIKDRLERGYVIADPKDYGELMDRLPDDKSALGNRIVRRNQTLMEIPDEGADSYRRQMSELIKRRKRDSREMVKKQAEALLKQAGYALRVVDTSKEERQ